MRTNLKENIKTKRSNEPYNQYLIHFVLSGFSAQRNSLGHQLN